MGGHLPAQRRGDLSRSAGTEIGHQQGVLDVGPGILVQRAGAEQPQQRPAEGVLRPGQPSAQPTEPARRRIDVIHRRWFVQSSSDILVRQRYVDDVPPDRIPRHRSIVTDTGLAVRLRAVRHRVLEDGGGRAE